MFFLIYLYQYITNDHYFALGFISQYLYHLFSCSYHSSFANGTIIELATAYFAFWTRLFLFLFFFFPLFTSYILVALPILQVYLLFSLTQLLKQPLLQGSVLYFMQGWFLETRIWTRYSIFTGAVIFSLKNISQILNIFNSLKFSSFCYCKFSIEDYVIFENI